MFCATLIPSLGCEPSGAGVTSNSGLTSLPLPHGTQNKGFFFLYRVGSQERAGEIAQKLEGLKVHGSLGTRMTGEKP